MTTHNESELMAIGTISGVVTAISALMAFSGWHDTWVHLMYWIGAVTFFVSLVALLISRCDTDD